MTIIKQPFSHDISSPCSCLRPLSIPQNPGRPNDNSRWQTIRQCVSLICSRNHQLVFSPPLPLPRPRPHTIEHSMTLLYTSTQIQIHEYKYANINTNTNSQIHKYKYTYTNSQIQKHKYKYKYTSTKNRYKTKRRHCFSQEFTDFENTPF